MLVFAISRKKIKLFVCNLKRRHTERRILKYFKVIWFHYTWFETTCIKCIKKTALKFSSKGNFSLEKYSIFLRIFLIGNSFNLQPYYRIMMVWI